MKTNLHALVKLLLSATCVLIQPALSKAQVYASGEPLLLNNTSQNAMIKQDQKSKTSLRELLFSLESAYQVSFNYDDDDVKGVILKEEFSWDKKEKIEKVLSRLLKDVKLQFERLDKNNFLIRNPNKKTTSIGSKTVTEEASINNQRSLTGSMIDGANTSDTESEAILAVSGKVISDTGESLPGVNVLIKGTAEGTTTDSDGRYSLNVTDGSAVLLFSFIGFISQEVAIGDRTTIDVTLAPDIGQLQEVVVVGYGTQEKKSVVSSITSISNEDFKHQPVTRFDQVLQGRAAGVQVMNTGGAPGSDVKIRIRGANSITLNNSPLYVIDGFEGGDFNNLNTHDIESIQVLKDASATAIYGNRGANGVVIVTTKRGNEDGRMKVNFSSNISTSRVLKTYETLGAAEYARIVNERNGSAVFTNEQIAAFEQQGGTNWQDELYRQAIGQEYQLSLTGGNDKTSYLISANLQDMEGIISNSDFKRQAIRSNIASQLSEKFSVRLNFSGVRRVNHNNGIGYSGAHSPVSQTLAWAPTTPLRDATGSYTVEDPTSSIYFNPLNLMYDQNGISEHTTGNLTGGLKYEFIPGLTLDVGFGADYVNVQGKHFSGPSVTEDKPYARRSSQESITLQSTNNLTYQKVFNTIHDLTFTAVYELYQNTYNQFQVRANNLQNPSLGFDNIAQALTQEANSGYSKYALSSLLGRVNYSLMDKYLITATVRRDGTSKFQVPNKFGTFPSIGLGWRISEESFMKDIQAISSLKLRGSWGMSGNQGISPYETLSTYGSVNVIFEKGGANIPGLALGQVENPDLKWETTEQINVGMDMELMAGRLFFSADYFKKNTRDVLLLQRLPDYLGGTLIRRNIGEVQNQGLEFSISGTPISNSNFNWNSTFNISTLKNKVIHLGKHPTARDTLFSERTIGAGLSSQPEFAYIVGQPLGSNWGLKYMGTWKKGEEELAAFYNAVPGDSRYQDVNGDTTITSDDFQVIGYSLPKYSLGWSNTFTYKNFDLNIFIQGVFGVDKLNYTYAAAMSMNGDSRETSMADIRNRWIEGVNETSDIPAFSATNVNYTQSSRFIEKGDFIRLKNISLTYRLPKTLTKSFGMSVYISGTNLLTFTDYKGIDPESSSAGSDTDTNQGIDYGSYPNSKIYQAGVNLSF